MNTQHPCNVFMLYPLFADTFSSFAESCKLMGVRPPQSPGPDYHCRDVA